MYKLKLFFVSYILVCSATSHGALLGNSIFVEPLIGYKSENTKLTDLALVTSEIKSSAPYAGLKLSYRTISGIELGLCGEYSLGKATVSTLGEKNNFSKSTAGVYVGVNSMGPVKMYLGAQFLNEFKIHESDITAESKFMGPGYNAGLVFQLFRHTNLGLQYSLNQYTKVRGSTYSLGEEADLYYSKIDTQDYSIYLAFDL